MTRPASPHARGFTFLELVISLALIMVLMTLLFPVFARARSAARRTDCMSNLSQLVGALHMYAQDNDGHFPPQEHNWSTTSVVYTKNQQVYLCPSEPKPSRDRFKPGTAARDALGRPALFSSYTYRAGLSNDDPAEEPVTQDWGAWHEGVCVGYLGGNVRWHQGREAPPTPKGPRPVPAGAPLQGDLATALGLDPQ
jgi:type II secretory pathway pseudopilin PulG